MKKSIYISGIICANLMMMGCIFKVNHWPGASVLLIFATVLFCFLFLPTALMSSYKEQNKYFWLHIVTYTVFSISMMGTLFKIQHWPGASIFLLVGIPLPFILFLPLYLYYTRKENKNGTLNFLGIMFGLIFLAVFSVLLALNVSREILNSFAANINMNEHAASFSEAKSNKTFVENKIKQKADELVDYIDSLKGELLRATGNSGLNADFQPLQIQNKDNTETPIKVLYGNGQSDKINVLKSKINAYRESLLASEKISPELTELVNALFDLNTKEISWEQREFSNYQLIIVLDVLSQIKSNVRLLESELLAS